jgi:hypothetical protein
MKMATTLKKPAAKKPTEWQEVGQRFEVLGTDLRRHFVKIGKDAAAQREALQNAVEALVKDIEKVFLAAGETLRVPVLRKDVAKIGEAVRTAVQDTVRTADAHRAAAGPRLHAATKPATAQRPAAKPATHKGTKAKHPA